MLNTGKSYLLVSCAMSVIAVPVAAQENNDDADGTRQQNVIIVTAQNRVQDQQDVPIRIDVISAEELAEAGFSDANDLGKIAPVAMIQQDQGTVQVTVRGVGNTAGGSTDNSVVTNLDGEYINTPAALGVALFDLERVEVLRGPQGTLYGRNATGGAVNFIARKPSGEFGANASISYGNYDALRLDAGIDIPISGDNIGARIAGFYEERDGYVSHPALPAGNYGGFAFPGYAAFRSDDNQAYGGRASFMIDDMDGFTFYIAAEASEREFTPQIFAGVDTHQTAFNPGDNCQNPGWEATAPLIPETLCIPSSTTYLDGYDRTTYVAPANGGGRQFWNTQAVRGRIQYEFSEAATLSYIGGYRRFERERGSTGSLPVVYANIVDNNVVETQSHELRLSGEIGNVIYQVGGFLFKEDVDSFGGFYLGDITPGTTNFGLWINYNLRNSDSESQSLFGQVEVPLTDQVTAIGGLRYTNNTNSRDWADKRGFFAFPTLRELNETNFVFAAPFTTEQDKVTWLLGVNYEPNPDTLIYAKVSTGFKGGGFDQVGEYGPETNTAYEAGLKYSFGPTGGNLLNLTGFYYDYSGLQVDVLLDSAEGGRVFNAGSATIWGVEAEAAFEVTENDFFNISVNYLNAEFNELFALYNVYCVPTSCGISAVGDLDPSTPAIEAPNFAGNTPAYSPEWIIAAGYEHVFELNSTSEITFRANTTFKSSYFTSFLNYSDEQQGSYTNTDLSLEYTHDSGFSLTAFVRNLENTRALSQAYFLAAGPDDIWNWQFGSPRLYGVRLAFEY